jgi:hypothetical protein
VPKLDHQLHSSLLNWRTIVAGLVLTIISLALLWLSQVLSAYSPLWFGQVLPSFASVVGTSGVFAVVYELLVRQQQTRYVLETLELRQSLIQAGLVDITVNYMEYDYAAKIKDAKDIVIFALYAQTWLNRYSPELTARLESADKSLTFVVPAFDNPFLPALEQHFGYQPDEVKRRIASVIATVVRPTFDIKLGKRSKVVVIMHKGHPAYSAYKFDNRLLLGSYYASTSRRRASMLEYVENPGGIFDDFSEDLEDVMKQGQVVFNSAEGINNLPEALGAFLTPDLKKSIDKLALPK